MLAKQALLLFGVFAAGILVLASALPTPNNGLLSFLPTVRRADEIINSAIPCVETEEEEENATTGELELREEDTEAGTGKVVVDATLKLLGRSVGGERDAAMRQIAEYMVSIQ